ncbi:MAG: hypothetical protein KDJ15_07965 [Alphaproteobacteria bacterium]|nr:hypothetical protein [Alphaproteobacteria bacterium]
MAKITAPVEYNLALIAEQAGQGDEDKRFYRNGELHVEGVTQAALDAALAGYDHATQAPVPEPSELEILKDALKTKGVLADADLTAAQTKLKGEAKLK